MHLRKCWWASRIWYNMQGPRLHRFSCRLRRMLMRITWIWLGFDCMISTRWYFMYPYTRDAKKPRQLCLQPHQKIVNFFATRVPYFTLYSDGWTECQSSYQKAIYYLHRYLAKHQTILRPSSDITKYTIQQITKSTETVSIHIRLSCMSLLSLRSRPSFRDSMTHVTTAVQRRFWDGGERSSPLYYSYL